MCIRSVKVQSLLGVQMLRKSKAILVICSVLAAFSISAQTQQTQYRDPTAPLGSGVKTKQTTRVKSTRLPSLNAVLCDKDTAEIGCEALINGRRVGQGQTVNGYLVNQINENSVTLKRNGRNWTLTVFNEQVVQ